MMNLSEFGMMFAIIGGIVSIIGNAIAISVAFTKLSTKLDNWIVIFSRFEDGYKEHKVHVNNHIDALWKKHDAMNDKLITLEAQK